MVKLLSVQAHALAHAFTCHEAVARLPLWIPGIQQGRNDITAWHPCTTGAGGDMQSMLGKMLLNEKAEVVVHKCRGAAAAVIVFDITNQDSFSKAKTWVKELQRQVLHDRLLSCLRVSITLLVNQRFHALEKPTFPIVCSSHC